MFLAYDQECWKIQLKVTKESIERVDFLFVITKKQTLKHAIKYRNQGINLVSDNACFGFVAPPTVIKLVRDISIYQAIGESFSAALPGSTRRLNWLLYSHCFAGNPALKILKSKGEYQTAFSRLCGDIENSPDTGDDLKIHVQSLWIEKDE